MRKHTRKQRHGARSGLQRTVRPDKGRRQHKPGFWNVFGYWPFMNSFDRIRLLGTIKANNPQAAEAKGDTLVPEGCMAPPVYIATRTW